MTEFQGFSELARLYAENASLVDRAKSQYSEEVALLLRALAQLSESPDQENGKSPQLSFERGFAYFWYGPEGSSRKDYIYLWVNPNDTAIVNHRRVRGHLYYAFKDSQVDQAGIAKLRQDPELANICVASKTSYSNQDFDFCWDGEDLTTAARQLALVLRKLSEIQVTL